MGVEIKAGQEKMEAKMNAWLEETKACQEVTEVCLEDMGTNQEKLETKMEDSQEKYEAMGLDVNQEKVEAVATCMEAMHVLVTLQGWAYDVVHGSPK
jgi:hypothetical protein